MALAFDLRESLKLPRWLDSPLFEHVSVIPFSMYQSLQQSNISCRLGGRSILLLWDQLTNGLPSVVVDGGRAGTSVKV